jgi:hypothetical protein
MKANKTQDSEGNSATFHYRLWAWSLGVPKNYAEYQVHSEAG